ncbi:MAG TPA: hypothetical protein VF765_24705 [Polyangiaceae bacterium]
MASCGTCGAEGLAPGQACPRCGSMPAPDLELGARPKPAAKPAKPRVQQEELSLELAVDPRELVAQRSALAAGAPTPPAPAAYPTAQVVRGGQAAPLARPPAPQAMAPRSGHPMQAQSDLETDALVLADYGDAPSSWLFAPMYAWRVLKRQRELKAALAVRKQEAEHAQTALEDALVALAERARPLAEKTQTYLMALEELSRAEDVLRSRDRVLAAEQDAQKQRLLQVDARIGKAEGDLAAAQANERGIAGELASAQGALARAEAKLKKAEGELKAVLQAMDKQRAGGTA